MQLIAKNIFKILVGDWKVSREVIFISTKKNHQQDNNKDLLLYNEVMQITDIGLEGYKKYKYKYDPSSQTITKYFSDDKIFYRLDVCGDGILGYHMCLSDAYKANYEFTDKNKFTLSYEVQGPKKNYIAYSIYSRIS